MKGNQHYEFWVSYYDELQSKGKLTEDAVKTANKEITECCWEEGTRFIPLQEQTLCFKVLYPGLLVGIGNIHTSQTVDGEIGLGFTLDSVTGLPFIPGSSIKGVLRSAFLSNRDYIAECLKTTLSAEQIEALELDIFGNYHPYAFYDKSIIDEGSGKDIFLDAYPIRADRENHLLGIESITPHLADTPEMEGLTAPIPLILLKIMPGVVIQFRFLLKDSKLNDDIIITAAEKMALFQTILCDLGVGAKTNVGFGSLQIYQCNNSDGPFRYLVQTEKNDIPDNSHSIQTSSSYQNQGKNPHQNTPPVHPRKQNIIYNATIIAIHSYGIIIKLDDQNVEGIISEIEDSKRFSVGDKVRVVKKADKFGKSLFSIQ